MAKPKPISRMRHVEVFIGGDGLAYFHVKGGNGAIMDESQGYRGRTEAQARYSARRGARRLHPSLPVIVTG